MTDTPAPMDTKTDALLATVRRHAEDSLRTIDDETRTKAQDIIAEAHKGARAKVHDAIASERMIGGQAIDKQRARIETAKRQALQDKESAFLGTAWEQLNAALLARWQDSGSRAQWLGDIVDAAKTHLHPGPWSIEHPSDWSTDEFAPFREACADEVSFTAVDDLNAGLRITANAATVDGSIEGLTSDRNEISATLLAELFQDAEVTS